MTPHSSLGMVGDFLRSFLFFSWGVQVGQACFFQTGKAKTVLEGDNNQFTHELTPGRTKEIKIYAFQPS